MAAALAQAGVGVGDTVALLAPNGIEWLEVAFGCAAVGARLAPVNTWVRVAELDYLLGFSRRTVLVAVDRAGQHDFLADLRELVPRTLAAAWSSTSGYVRRRESSRSGTSPRAGRRGGTAACGSPTGTTRPLAQR